MLKEQLLKEINAASEVLIAEIKYLNKNNLKKHRLGCFGFFSTMINIISNNTIDTKNEKLKALQELGVKIDNDQFKTLQDFDNYVSKYYPSETPHSEIFLETSCVFAGRKSRTSAVFNKAEMYLQSTFKAREQQAKSFGCNNL